MDENSWMNIFQELNVEMCKVPFSLKQVEKAEVNDIQECENEFGTTFPRDYCAFCCEIGAGSLGRVRIYCPTRRVGLSDPRIQNGRLKNRFSNDDYSTVHSFPMDDLIVIGQDLSEDFWFGFRKSYLLLEEPDFKVYCFDETSNAPPPRIVANNFTEFVKVVCLGPKISKLGIKKFNEEKLEDNAEEEWDSDESDDTVDPLHLPPLKFIPFPSR